MAMTIKMKSGLNLNSSQSPKVQMRKIIISRGSHRQVNKDNYNNSKGNLVKYNGSISKTNFFQEELLLTPRQKSNLLIDSQQKNNLNLNSNSYLFKKKSQTRLSSSLSKISRGLSGFSDNPNPQYQKSLKSKGSSLSLRKDSFLSPEQIDNKFLPNNQIKKSQVFMQKQNVQKILNQLEQKLQGLIKQKLYQLESQLKLKKVIQNSTTTPKKLQQNLLKLVQTEQFETIQQQIQKVQKQLAQINIDQIKSKQGEQNQQNLIRLAEKKSKIIEKIMAQGIVESELYKKYYMGSVSMDRSKQYRFQKPALDKLKNSQELFLNRNKATSLNRSPKQVQQIQSLSKQSYRQPKNQDYQTYRYKQPLYKPNLQPLPRSVYKAQYLKSSPNQMEKKCSLIQNIIFGKSQRSKSSNYRDSFNQVHQKHELVNHKQLDAYKDKFRDIKLSYIPKKRTQTQETNRKIKKLHTTAYLKQLKSTKLFALQSQRSAYEMKGLEPLKQSFLSQIKREFQGSPGLKSQIKHKQLNNFRYQFKKMFHS